MYLFCFLWLKYLPILLPEFGFLSATYFAQNSAGKNYQGLDVTQPYLTLPSRTCLVMLAITAPPALVARMLRKMTIPNEASSPEKVTVPPKPESMGLHAE